MTETPFSKPGSGAEPEKKPAQDQAAETIKKDFEELKESKMAEVEKTYEEAISAGSEALEERALVSIREMKEKQKQEVGGLVEAKHTAFLKESAKSTGSREALASEMLKTAEKEAQDRITQLQAIINRHKKDKYLTTAEAFEVEKTAQGVQEMVRKDQRLQTIFVKLETGTEEPSDAEYRYIVNLINPYDITKQGTDVKKTFDVSSSGILLAAMSPEQRLKLVELFMKTPDKRKDTVALVDALLRTGQLSREQGYQIFPKIVEEKLMTPEQFQQDFKEKLDQGYYQKEVEKFQQIVSEEIQESHGGRFSQNIVERASGAPLLGALLSIWGSVLAAMNVAANWDKDHPMQGIQNALKSPYTWLGFAGMAGGAEIATGTLKKGGDWVGGGVIGRGLDSLGEKSEDAEAEHNKRMKKNIAEVYLTAPTDVVGFLEGGGFNTMRDVRSQLLEKKEKPVLQIDKLLEAEKNPEQKKRLQNMKTLKYLTEEEATAKLTIVTESAVNLKIEKNEDFVKLLADLKKEKKEEQGSAKSDTAKPPAPKTSPFKP